MGKSNFEINETVLLELNKQICSVQTQTKNNSCVYYCLFGEYDDFTSLTHRLEENIDYYLVTDQSIKIPGIKTVNVAINLQSKRRANRFFKLNPHLLFKPYKYSIYIDTNISITGDLNKLFNMLENDEFILFKHNKRNCVYKEIKECKRWKRDAIKVLNQQQKKLKSKGIPFSFGLYLGAVLVRNHDQIKEFSKSWWKNYQNGSSRDQISLIETVFDTGIYPKSIEFSNFNKFFNREAHRDKDITEKNLNYWESLNLRLITFLYNTYKWLRNT